MPDENAPPVGGNPPPPPPPPADDKPATGPNARPLTANVDNEAGTSTATGTGTDALGQQVHPSTQVSEADGHRTLMNPVTDPGPYIREGMPDIQHPDRTKGQHRYGEANEPLTVMMRTSTGHDEGFARPGGPTHTEQTLPPEVLVNGAASDMYHPHREGQTSLTAEAQRLAAQARQPAPLRTSGDDAPPNGNE